MNKGFLNKILTTLLVIIILAGVSFVVGGMVFGLIRIGSLQFSFTGLTKKEFTTLTMCILLVFALLILGYYMLFFKGKASIFKVKDKAQGRVESNLENSQFMSGDERDKNFIATDFKLLSTQKKDGVCTI